MVVSPSVARPNPQASKARCSKMKSTLSLFSLVIGAVIAMTGSAAAELQVGDAVPDFEMVGSDGNTYSNKTFQGKKAYVIAWYPKAFTGG